MDKLAAPGPAVGQGQAFFRQVMEWDAKKGTLSTADLQMRLNDTLAAYLRSAGLKTLARMEFVDVHAKMGRQWHTELAYVEVNGADCRLYFDQRLAVSEDPNAGLVFVAKSWVLLRVLDVALASSPALAASFVFEIGDNATLGEVGFNSSHPDACLIVDHDFAASDGYAAYREICDARLVPWEERAPTIFWRGSTTGQRLFTPPAAEPDDLSWLPRLHLCQRCKHASIRDLCDVGVTRLQQIPEPQLRARILTAGLIKESVPREVFMQHRGAFDIDGNANAWSGLFCSLLGASCILKVASPNGYRQWYYDRLIPWENYVPIRSDLSDLDQAVAWFAGHDAEARRIAARGRDLAVSIDLPAGLAASAANLLAWIARR